MNRHRRPIDCINAIARQKQHNVMFLRFHLQRYDDYPLDKQVEYNFQKDHVRQLVINLLDASGIAWSPCTECRDNVPEPYQGQIYLDVPCNKNNQQYQKVLHYFRKENGKMRIPTVQHCYRILNPSERKRPTGIFEFLNRCIAIIRNKLASFQRQ